jgi:DNA-binding Lrp family transcriptional regulator
MQSAAERVAERLSEDVDADILKQVEDALRHYADVVYLAQSPLAERLNLSERPRAERGWLLQRHLQEAVKSLRPEGERPPEPIRREWYHYVILHDAYLKGVPNREVMARLYVSEGTFHRARRQAIRGAARWLTEKHGGTAHNTRN